MASRNEEDTMPWEPDWDTAIWLTWFTAGVFFLIFLVSLIGELLGWWDLIGEIGMSAGAVLSILLALGAIVASASRRQVTEVGQDVQAVGQDVQTVGEEVRGVHQAVRANGVQLEKLDELDVIQAELDVQTGVMDEQLAVLGQIRDRL